MLKGKRNRNMLNRKKWIPHPLVTEQRGLKDADAEVLRTLLLVTLRSGLWLIKIAQSIKISRPRIWMGQRLQKKKKFHQGRRSIPCIHSGAEKCYVEWWITSPKAIISFATLVDIFGTTLPYWFYPRFRFWCKEHLSMCYSHIAIQKNH